MKLQWKKIILAIIILVLAGAGFWFFLVLDTEDRNEITENTRNLFPFGQTTRTGEVPDTNPEQSANTDDTVVQITDGGVVIENQPEEPRLRPISDFPTGGFGPITRDDTVDVIETYVDENGVATDVSRTIEVENQYVRYTNIKDASIFESYIDPTQVQQELLIENFIPNAERAEFNNDGSRIMFQYWNNEQNVPESYLAKLERIVLEVEPCPFVFEPITLGQSSDIVLGIHTFLNRNTQTRIARMGINSPGNEGSLATEATLTAIKNFQSLYQINIDGQVGSGTKTKMQEVCDLQQEKLAREAFNALDTKYRLSGFFLPQNIITSSMSPLGDQLFYLQKDPTGVIGIVRDLATEVKKTIFESPFSEWTSFWNSDTNIELATKPSYASDGYSYYLDPTTERYFKSLSSKKALITLPSPDNSSILISEMADDRLTTSLVDRASGRIQGLDIQTLPDKCVWTRNNLGVYCGVPNALSRAQYPDLWYQGQENFQDSLWFINATTLETNLVSDLPREFNANIDVESIGIDQKNEYLYFIDKQTEYLWSYRLVDY